MGPANRAPTGSGKRTRVPAVSGDPGSVQAPVDTDAAVPATVLARAARSHNSGWAVAISGTREGVGPGSVSSTRMSQPSSEAAVCSRPPAVWEGWVPSTPTASTLGSARRTCIARRPTSPVGRTATLNRNPRHRAGQPLAIHRSDRGQVLQRWFASDQRRPQGRGPPPRSAICANSPQECTARGPCTGPSRYAGTALDNPGHSGGLSHGGGRKSEAGWNPALSRNCDAPDLGTSQVACHRSPWRALGGRACRAGSRHPAVRRAKEDGG